MWFLSKIVAKITINLASKWPVFAHLPVAKCFWHLGFITAAVCCFRLLSRVFPPLQTQGKAVAVYRRLCSAATLPVSACSGSAVKFIMEPKLYRPPPEVRGMTSLDKEAFTQTITVPALRVPTGVLNKVVKSLKKSAIQCPGIPRVVQDKEESSDFRLVLLDPHKVSSAASFSEAEAEALRSFSVPEELQHYELQLTYHNLKTEEVLEAVLPQGQDVTSSFSRVGHIAHMNLRDHQLPYKSLIGERQIMQQKDCSTKSHTELLCFSINLSCFFCFF